MTGPETLETDHRPARGRTWVVLALVVLAVAGLGGVRLAGLLPDPQPPGPTPSRSVGPAATWPGGAGTGTLYVLDVGGVAAVDVANGTVQQTPVSVDQSLVSITAGGPGVVLWFVDGDGTPRLVTAGSSASPTVSGTLAEARDLLPGPGTAVWASFDDGVEPDGPSTWRLVDVDGSVAATARLRGGVESDGAGGLFETRHGNVRDVVDGRSATSWTGRVAAVGPDGYTMVRCSNHQCDHLVHDRGTGVESVLTTPPTDGFVTALSPGNRFVASVEPESDDDDGPQVLRVTGPAAVRTLPLAPDVRISVAWLSDRWLAVTDTPGLMLYDAVDDRVVHPGLGIVLPTQLVFRPA